MESFRVVLALDSATALAQVESRFAQSCLPFVIVAAVTDGHAALAAIAAHQPDLLIADLALPAPGGLELAAQVREVNTELCILLLGNALTGEATRRALRLGIADCLHKPLRTAELEAALSRLARTLQQRRRTTELQLLFQAFLCGPFNTVPPLHLIGNRLTVYSLCLGNLCNHTPQAPVVSTADTLLDAIDWDLLLGAPTQGDILFFLLRERLANQRLLLSVQLHNASFDPVAFASRLQGFVESRTGGRMPVTVALLDEHMEYQTIALSVENTREFLRRQLRPCLSGVLLPDLAPAAFPDAAIPHEEIGILMTFAQGNKVKEAVDYIENLLWHWQEDSCTQQQLESRMQSIASALCRAQGTELTAEDCTALMQLIAEATDLQMLCTTLSTALGEFVSQRADGTAPQKLYLAVKAYLEQSYADSITGAALSERFGCHAQYISRIFHQMEGVPLSQHLAQLRISHAKRLIALNPKLDIAHIAASVGYDDYPYFIRVFKRYTGQTPTQYRQGIIL